MERKPLIYGYKSEFFNSLAEEDTPYLFDSHSSQVKVVKAATLT
jgi:hypothetical protein